VSSCSQQQEVKRDWRALHGHGKNKHCILYFGRVSSDGFVSVVQTQTLGLMGEVVGRQQHEVKGSEVMMYHGRQEGACRNHYRAKT
jgi:hypothetical protein